MKQLLLLLMCLIPIFGIAQPDFQMKTVKLNGETYHVSETSMGNVTTYNIVDASGESVTIDRVDYSFSDYTVTNLSDRYSEANISVETIEYNKLLPDYTPNTNYDAINYSNYSASDNTSYSVPDYTKTSLPDYTKIE